MWEQQLLSDISVASQLEAAAALGCFWPGDSQTGLGGEDPVVAHAVQALQKTLAFHRWHPFFRSVESSNGSSEVEHVTSHRDTPRRNSTCCVINMEAHLYSRVRVLAHQNTAIHINSLKVIRAHEETSLHVSKQ